MKRLLTFVFLLVFGYLSAIAQVSTPIASATTSQTQSTIAQPGKKTVAHHRRRVRRRRRHLRRRVRRIKILADLNDAQLSHLSDFMELQRVSQWTTVVRQGDPGDAMYLILEGELRARVMVGELETILATFGPGDFFGDIALFDHGPRSADVLANVDSSLLRISSVSFERLAKEAPALATPFLQATSRTLASRIRADNKRLGQMSQQFSASGRS